ncbi:hypothetical protein JTE90_019862 [Oedothorax gibbosus]|uniref:Uncharacterized protein n=1 Tax=Oedothorax gibbosus TaxID=931172 RepID=A0AAV6VYF2_9ARAC|nr:hypothetical protein JTE90_019862 [Oedothorax gibbosus]
MVSKQTTSERDRVSVQRKTSQRGSSDRGTQRRLGPISDGRRPHHPITTAKTHSAIRPDGAAGHVRSSDVTAAKAWLGLTNSSPIGGRVANQSDSCCETNDTRLAQAVARVIGSARE